jgi:hypothetical protein
MLRLATLNFQNHSKDVPPSGCALGITSVQERLHLKRILRLDRLRLRGPCGARDEFHLAATAQNLRKLAKLIPMPQPQAA